MRNKTSTLILHGFAVLGGLACALMLLVLFRKDAVLFTTPEGFVVERAAHTTVYAPSMGAAHQGQQELQYARKRFRDLFGIPAADLIVLLTDDPQQHQRLDTTPLRQRGIGFLPFITRAHLDSTTLKASAAPRTEMKPLAHEACHFYVSALANQVASTPARSRGSYGHRILPDWFDEASATLCESPEARAERRNRFREGLDERIPLREFEQMPHPLSEPETLHRLGINRASGYAGVQMIPGNQVRQLIGERVELFYAQALSLGEFIADRGGSGVLGSLVRPLANGRTLEQALREVNRKDPRLPATIDEFETEWIRWVESGGG